jgi:hypothetical protein
MITSAGECVENILTRTSLKLAQLEDVNIAEDRSRVMANIILSSAQEELLDTKLVTSSSLIMYNVSKHELISQSLDIPIIDSNDLLNWWRSVEETEIGIPTIYLSVGMMDFCKQYKNEKIYVQSIHNINSVLFPSSLVAKDKNGNELGVHEEAAPTLSTQYPKKTSMLLEVVGNDANDALYELISDFKFQKVNPMQSDEVTVVYNEAVDGEAVKLCTNTFTINENEYRVDCVYQTSFWFFARQYIILFEIISILICAVIAFINTKETLWVYN